MTGLLKLAKKLIDKLTEKYKEHKDAIEGIIVALLIIGTDEILEVLTFDCPCVAESDLAVPCTGLNFCPLEYKKMYGCCFILAPSIILFMAGLTFNETV